MLGTVRRNITSFLGLALLVSQVAIAQRILPADNLAYPVLITLKGGSGSGFYLSTPKTMYLVTAKHVLFDPATQVLRDSELELLSYSKDISDPTPYVLTVGLSTLGKDNIAAHPTEDVAVVRIASFVANASDGEKTLSMLPGVKIKEKTERTTSSLLGGEVSIVKTFDQVLIGNEVVVFGYPTSLGLQALPQIDSHRPLLRKGIVAGNNPQKHSIILDCASYPGNSGGPVLQVEPLAFGSRFYLIGVISQFVPFADVAIHPQYQYSSATIVNSGYSIATPMDFVLELIKQFGDNSAGAGDSVQAK